MFNFRNGDGHTHTNENPEAHVTQFAGDDYNYNYGDNHGDADGGYTQANRKTKDRHHSHSRSSQDAITQIGNRPKHLPPLIQTLVGNINIDANGDIESSSSSTTTTAIRPSPKIMHTKPNPNPNSNPTADSVAMVAAAAAAAVWSGEGKRGRSARMKVYNDEWEEALRWISTWGQNQEQQQRQRQHQHSVDSNAYGSYAEGQDGKHSGYRNQPSRYGKRRADIQGNGNGIGNYQDSSGSATSTKQDTHTRDADKLLDICTKKCLGDQFTTSEDQDQGISAPSPLPRESQGILRQMGISQMLSSIQSSQMFLASRYSQRVVRNILGVLLSTAVIWFLRNASDWWKLNRYSVSLQQLLQEESDDVHTSSNALKQGKHHVSGRKQKKKRRKRDNRTSAASQDPHEGALEDMKRWNPLADDSDSDDSLDCMYLLRGPRVHSNTVDSSSSDQGSKGTNSTASVTTADSIQTHYTEVFNGARQESNRSFKMSPTPVERNLPQSRPTYPVPTEAQREEAHQKIKVFQQIQLQKLVEHNRKLKTGISSMAVTKTEKMSMRDVVAKNLPKDPVPSDAKKKIAPPPGLSIEPSNIDPKLSAGISFENQVTCSEENDVDLMLSNILDEDDGAIDIDKTKHTSHHSEVSKANLDHDRTKSVALGDLLVLSAFRDSGNQTSPAIPVSSPWHSPVRLSSVGSRANVETGVDQRGYNGVDANIQLQVSAAEFLPSWEQAANVAASTKIW